MATEHSEIIALLGGLPSKPTLPPQPKMAKWCLTVPEHFLTLSVMPADKSFLYHLAPIPLSTPPKVLECTWIG